MNVTNESPNEKKEKKCNSTSSAQQNAGGMVYCLGIIGAAIYFISISTGFWMGVLGILKAIIWPVFVVYGLLKYLAM
jgi:hypothetical protein